MEERMESLVFEAKSSSPEPGRTSFPVSSFITEYGEIDGKSAIRQLTDQATTHSLIGQVDSSQLSVPIEQYLNFRYRSDEFFGIMIDTGAAHHSTAGYSQYIALQKYQNVQIDKTKAGALTVQFGIGSATSIGVIEVKTPIGDINFHIVQADTPFLLSLNDLDLLGVYFNNLTNRIYYGPTVLIAISQYQ